MLVFVDVDCSQLVLHSDPEVFSTMPDFALNAQAVIEVVKGVFEMTMPHERTRSLRWGHEVLHEIAREAALDLEHRERAAALLTVYPAPDTASMWIDEDVACIPVAAATAVDDASVLMASIARSKACPAVLERSLTFALRHFPEPGSVQGWTRAVEGLRISDWLLPEGAYA